MNVNSYKPIKEIESSALWGFGIPYYVIKIENDQLRLTICDSIK